MYVLQVSRMKYIVRINFGRGKQAKPTQIDSDRLRRSADTTGRPSTVDSDDDDDDGRSTDHFTALVSIIAHDVIMRITT